MSKVFITDSFLHFERYLKIDLGIGIGRFGDLPFIKFSKRSSLPSIMFLVMIISDYENVRSKSDSRVISSFFIVF